MVLWQRRLRYCSIADTALDSLLANDIFYSFFAADSVFTTSAGIKEENLNFSAQESQVLDYQFPFGTWHLK